MADEEGQVLLTEIVRSNTQQDIREPEVRETQSGDMDEFAAELVREELQNTLNQAVDKLPGDSEVGKGVAAGSMQTNAFSDDVVYIEPVQDPYSKAITYLEKHNILQLFQALTTNIVYNRPKEPLDFMIEEIEELKRVRDGGTPRERKRKDSNIDPSI